jgi:chitinase
VSDYISAALFEELFKHRNDPACASNGFYTYAAFTAAAAAFPGFGTSSADPAVNKRELAAFLAQISHETTGGWATAPDGPYSWGLCWVTEGGKTPPWSPYCEPSAAYPCAEGKTYYGRGPMQLSWNYNYIPAGEVLGFDGLNNPEIVAQDPVIAFKTAIWFWMTPRLEGGKPSCHDVMIGAWTPTARDSAAGRVPGFGATTNIINGGLECGSGAIKAQEADRIGYYQRYASLFGVTVGDNLSCENQKDFRY